MTIEMDHAIIYVDQLDKAVVDFGALGFNVLRGGEHTQMGTHNALITFQDHTYIELLAALPGRTPQGFPGRVGAEGFAGFCLRSDKLADEMSAVSERGVGAAPLRQGSRTRTDGQLVEWWTATLEGIQAPFFIEDISERRLRISDEIAANHHENEVVGAEALTVLVEDVGEAAQRYANILGELPRMVDEDAVFDIQGFFLTLRAPNNDEERSYLEERPHMPYELVLRTQDHRRVGLLTPGQTHSARIHLSAASSPRQAGNQPA